MNTINIENRNLIKRLFVLLMGVTSLNGQAIYDPDNNLTGEEVVIAAWNFNWNPGETQFQKRETQRTVSHGLGIMVDNFSVPYNVPKEDKESTSGLTTNGSNINLFLGDIPGQSLNVPNGDGSDPVANNGGFFQFELDCRNIQSLKFSYAGRRNNNLSFSDNQWSYSIDGENFTNIGSPLSNPVGTVFETFTINLPGEVDGMTTVYIRNTISGTAANNPNYFNLYDNIIFTGIVSSGTSNGGNEDTWYEFPRDDNDNVNTGDLLGWLNVKGDPWVYSWLLDGWIYVHNLDNDGAWLYILK